MDVLRTPEERFGQLPGFGFQARYLDDLPGFEGLRLHYVDEGPPDSEVFVCLHGEPTWAYLYRHMIPVFARAGLRVVAPDFFGFGRSDKPVDENVYTFDFHRKTLKALLERLDLRAVTLVCQDWGGLLGLTLPMEMPQRFNRLLVMNTMLAGGDAPLPEGFTAWRKWAAEHPDMETGKLLGRACPQLGPAEHAAYDAPFPDVRYKAGVRRFPQLVPDRPDAPGAAISRAARDWWSRQWNGASFMAIGMKDPVLGPPVMKALQKTIRGCPAAMEVAEAGHFVPEWGGRIAAAALAAFFAY
ncbi:MAG: haloalkane dehalogenase [Burkholderiales bacterium]